MKTKLDTFVGSLTQQETVDLFQMLIGVMPDEDVAAVLDEELSDTIKEELVSLWYEDDGGKEE